MAGDTKTRPSAPGHAAGPAGVRRGPGGGILPAMRLGFGEILVILVIALLVFGPTKLPQLGDALGKGIRNFKKASEGLFDEEPAEKKPEPTLQSPESPPAPAATPEKTEAKKS